VAGGTAGAIEAATTYPFEAAKTRLQFRGTGVNSYPTTARNPLVLIQQVVRRDGIRNLYAGADALIIGTAWKAAVRFLGFDTLKALFADEKGRTSKAGGVLAGFGAGILESVLAVTPFETIKTALIDDARRPATERRFRGFASTTAALFREQGVRGLYKGLLPVTLRQAANSSVRMGSYNALKEVFEPKTSIGIFGIGALAGTITVYTTMPLDTVKTRMQALGREYSSTLNCAVRVFREEGVFAFWRGATARWLRLVLSGGIVFTVYERTLDLLS
jgi:solute carrier family 25 citrate transporter 1